MTIKVLVVDDSSFFRRRLTEILAADPELEVVDTANNGQQAIEKAIALKPDVITMDIEMPVMDGITAVREIMRQQRTPILMFSSLTHEGAKATLDALDAGAVDFLPKKFEDIARDKDDAVALLRQRVKAVARKRAASRASVLPRSSLTRSSFERPKLSERMRESTAPARPASSGSFKASGKKYKLVMIGTSTGGPVALQRIITALPASFPLPIVLIQHMPAAFTGAFATRLNGLSKITVKEAQDNDVLKAGVAYLAPGGKQMLIEGSDSQPKLRIKEDNSPRITFKPSVDITFGSAGRVFKDQVLALILTGMGADGREGARLLKQHGARIWAQDEASCVVYGMPQAVAAAGLMDVEISLADAASNLIAEVTHG